MAKGDRMAKDLLMADLAVMVVFGRRYVNTRYNNALETLVDCQAV